MTTVSEEEGIVVARLAVGAADNGFAVPSNDEAKVASIVGCDDEVVIPFVVGPRVVITS